ncbi:MAG: hypothetical protein ACRDJB_06130 [Actinomycetota bacterium]
MSEFASEQLRCDASASLSCVWGLDFQFDQTSDGKVLKLLNIVDEHTREELGGLVEVASTRTAPSPRWKTSLQRENKRLSSFAATTGPS